MAFQQPNRWNNWLSMAEWWYNTSFHTALQMTPFQALYAKPPPLIAELLLPPAEGESHQQELDRESIAKQIKSNLLKAQERMKHFADKKRSDRKVEVGDMVYIKLQPYRHTSLSIHRKLKLHSKYYGPFKELEKIGRVAYKVSSPS